MKLRLVFVPILSIILPQAICFYLFWVYGASWEETPRGFMAVMCTFMLFLGCMFFNVSEELKLALEAYRREVTK